MHKNVFYNSANGYLPDLLLMEIKKRAEAILMDARRNLNPEGPKVRDTYNSALCALVN
jgi:hypothetical protein